MLKKVIFTTAFLLVIISTGFYAFRPEVKAQSVPLAKIKEDTEKNKEQMIAFLSKAIQYQSVEDYGYDLKPQTKELMDFVFKQAEEIGFTTRRAAGGLVGVLETGEGDETVGVLIHLDVVPAGSEGDPWTHPPFSGAVVDGEIWGRGAQDDKGALAATLWAAKALIDNNLDFKRKLRIILGTKEEKNFEGLIKYFEEEKQPDFGIVPDGAFLTRGEKGIADINVSFSMKESPARDSIILWEGGTVVNTVPDFSYLVIKSESPKEALQETQEKLMELTTDLAKGSESSVPGLKEAYTPKLKVTSVDEFKKDFPKISITEGDIVVYSLGQATHGSTPWSGRNAIVEVALLADRLDKLSANAYKSAASFASQKIGFGFYGQYIDNNSGEGIPYAPPKGVAPAPKIPGFEPEMYYGTSVNLGLVRLSDNEKQVELALDFRTGIGNTSDQILDHTVASAAQFDGQAAYQPGLGSHYESFYLHDDNPLLKMLFKSYRKTFPDNPETTPYLLFSPASTYMKLVKNFSNFGPVDLYPDPSASHFHQKDERFSVKALTETVWVYAEAMQQMIQAEKAPIYDKVSQKESRK